MTSRFSLKPAAGLAAVVALAWPAATATAAPAAATATAAATAPSRESAPASGAGGQHRVIVILTAQPAMSRPGTRAGSERSAAIASLQAPLLRQLRRADARHIVSYRLVDAFAATVPAGALAALAASPAVARVIPDVMIHAGPAGPAGPAPASRRPATGEPSAVPRRLTPHVIPQACGRSGQVQLEPEALRTTHAAAENPGAATARSLGFTGAGVRVGFIADGLDPRNVNFIRADGRSVFDRAFGGDYQDFSGDGPGQLTQGAEAFLDANSIAGQGIHVYDVRHFAAQADPASCDIRIQGVAPGAALVGLNVYGSFEFTLESNFLQAINYAVQTDHVNVLNESFGANPFPDSASLSVLKRFNDAAVAAGTTVTVAAGDSGSTNTIGSPATDPLVISVGATTAFQFYAQTNFAAARYFATTGWLDDNVSAISSGGFTTGGGTVDLVAPGDLGFASCSRNVQIYQACVNLNGQPSPVELSGGTSESAPLTAGAAALVIQAYRQTHAGSTPSPALVKQILVSTASDLGLPATEQGAGLLNCYKAVQLAESVKTSAGAPRPAGDTLEVSRTQLSAAGPAGARRKLRLTVTNAGQDTQLISAHGRGFGPDQQVQRGTLRLDDAASPQFTDSGGLPNNYAIFHFTVRPGADRLDAAIAYQGVQNGSADAPVWLILIDPRGRFAADSIPQGAGNFGNVDVRAPVAGTWTGVVFSITGFENGTTGKVRWQVATQRFTGFGQVRPGAFALVPGQSRTLVVTERLPRTAGDAAGAVVISSNLGGFDQYLGAERGSIPVTLRARVNLASGGQFSGVLTGGNGRPTGTSQADYFEFLVGPGQPGITASVALARDRADTVGAYLIGPDGQALGFGQNSLNGQNSLSLTAYALHPSPGTWTLAVDFAGPVAGDLISQPFTGTIRLGSGEVAVRGLPDNQGRRLRRGVPVKVRVLVTNTGQAPEAYFADPRLDTSRTSTLESLTGQTYLLPLTVQPEWFVPAETSSVVVTARATDPVEFDYGPFQGDPDLLASPGPGDRAEGSFAPALGEVQPGYWVAGPDQLGPYPHGAPAASVTMTMRVRTKAFDPAMTASTGDLWHAAVDLVAPFGPVTIAPGRSGVITVTIRPRGKPGTIVRGTLYIDDYVSSLPPFDQATGDEVAAIPYAYRVR